MYKYFFISDLLINEYKKNSNTRDKIITFKDAILFRFLYSQYNMTKQLASCNINYYTSNNCNRTSYDRKENNINVKIYQQIYYNICTFYKNNCTSSNDLIKVAVDGTYCNSNINKSNKIETSLNMGYYDISNNIPLDLTFNGSQNKNKEVKLLIDYVKKSKISNIIIVADRMYYSFELLNTLKEHNISYIIRIKSNSDLIKLQNKLTKNKNLYVQEILKHNRIIKNTHDITKQVKTKKNIKKTLNIKSEYILITNLKKDKYNDNEISNIYNSRWEIEVYFKYIKENFNFKNMHERNENKYQKLIYCQLILTYFSKILQYFYLKNKKITSSIKKRNNDTNSCSVKINQSNLIKGIYKYLLFDLINGTLILDKINIFCNSYMILIKNELNRSFPRISKIPFSKWYVKAYHSYYKYNTLIENIENNTTEKLHKNLKTHIKDISIIE